MPYRSIDKLKRWLVFGAAAVWLVSSLPVSAQAAADSFGLTISPAIIDQAVPIGSQTQLSLTLTNDSQQAAMVSARIEPFFLTSDQLISGGSPDRFDITSWLKLPMDSWVLSAGESKPVLISVWPQPDTPPGSYYSQVVFRLINQTVAETSSASKVTPEVTALLFVTIPGRQTHSIVTSLVDIPRLVIGSGLKLDVIATNRGNTHEIVTITTRQEALLALDRQTRTAPQPFSMILPDTSKTISLNYSFAGLFNRYKITADLSYGMPIESSATKSIEVWVVSVWAIIIVAALLLLVATGLRSYLIKRRVKFNFEQRVSHPHRLKKYRTRLRRDEEQ